MLQQPQTSLYDNILQDGSRRDVNCTAFRGDDDDCSLEDNTSTQIHGAGDGQMIELQHLWDARNTLLEVADLFEVGSKLDQWGWTKAIRADDKLAMSQAIEIGLDEH